MKLKLTEKFVSEVIKREIDPSHAEFALMFLHELTTRKNKVQNFTIHDISKITNLVSASDLWELAFELTNLSTPLLDVYVIYYDENGEEVFEDDYDLVKIFSKDEIVNPFNNEILSYSEYENNIEILFRANKELLDDIITINSK